MIPVGKFVAIPLMAKRIFSFGYVNWLFMSHSFYAGKGIYFLCFTFPAITLFCTFAADLKISHT